VGVAVGSGVGVAVGATVAVSVGVDVGVAVGVDVGATVGDGDGVTRGAGAAVGMGTAPLQAANANVSAQLTAVRRCHRRALPSRSIRSVLRENRISA